MLEFLITPTKTNQFSLDKLTWQYGEADTSTCLDLSLATVRPVSSLRQFEFGDLALENREILLNSNGFVKKLNILYLRQQNRYKCIKLLRNSSASGMASSNCFRLIIGVFNSRKNNLTTPVILCGSFCSFNNR